MKKLLILAICSTLCMASEERKSASTTKSSSSSGYLSLPSSISKSLAQAPTQFANSVDLTKAVKELKVEDAAKHIAQAVDLSKLTASMAELKQAVEASSQNIATAMDLEKLKAATANLEHGLEKFGSGLDTKTMAQAFDRATAKVTQSFDKSVLELNKTAADTAKLMAQETKRATVVVSAAAKDAIKEIAEAFDFAKLEKIKAHIALSRQDALNVGACIACGSSAGAIACYGCGCGSTAVLLGSMCILWPDKMNQAALEAQKIAQRTYKNTLQQYPTMRKVESGFAEIWKKMMQDTIVEVPLSPSSSMLAQAPQPIMASSSSSNATMVRRITSAPALNTTTTTNHTTDTDKETKKDK